MIEIKHRLTGAVLHIFDASHLCDANLRGADLSDANLRNANLRGADLRGADLRSASLYYANLRSASLSYANMACADLRGADLRGADLHDANLRGANLRDANLRGANLHDATRYENEKIEAFTSIERIGSRGDTLTLFKCTSGIYAETGCFTGPLADFEAAVLDTHTDNQHAQAYGAAIKLAKIIFA